jgi:ubiquitin carboxyl-terminal hydrolase 48
MHKLNYCNEDICVILVRGKEVPKSILEASKGLIETDRRVSKRSRKTKNGSSVSLKVSASTSLYQLKMMIWESFGVSKLYVVCVYALVQFKCCPNKNTLKIAK